MTNPIHCPACGDLMLENQSPFYGSYMRVCFNCGKPWSISCYDRKSLAFEPFDSDGDPMIESIIAYNYDEGRRKRGIR